MNTNLIRKQPATRVVIGFSTQDVRDLQNQRRPSLRPIQIYLRVQSRLRPLPLHLMLDPLLETIPQNSRDSCGRPLRRSGILNAHIDMVEYRQLWTSGGLEGKLQSFSMLFVDIESERDLYGSSNKNFRRKRLVVTLAANIV